MQWNARQKLCVSCALCKASDSEHEIVMTNKKDFMGRNEELRQIAADLVFYSLVTGCNNGNSQIHHEDKLKTAYRSMYLSD